jgi:hypothetical protein
MSPPPQRRRALGNQGPCQVDEKPKNPQPSGPKANGKPV